MARIYTRPEWGARFRNGVGARPIGNLECYLHHSVTAQLPETATFAQDAAAVRTVEAIGEQRFGAGISYNILITPSGRIFQGTGIGRVSYHSGPGRNTRGFAICLVGNYEQFRLGTPGFNALVTVLRHARTAGWRRTTSITETHRQFSATACPGKNAVARVSDANRAAAGSSAPAPKPPAIGGGGSSGSSKASPAGTHAVANATITARLDRAGYPRMTYLRDRIARFQRDQIYAPGLKPDGIWGPWTERHWAWVREFQRLLNQWAAVQPKLQVDGDYRANTARGCQQHQDGNAGARSSDRNRSRRIPNSSQRRVLSRNLGIHPGAS